MSHACELETSVYLYLNESAVQMDKAEKEIGFHHSKYYWHDLGGGPPVRMVEWWSRISQVGRDRRSDARHRAIKGSCGSKRRSRT